jgi:hypothetical protein
MIAVDEVARRGFDKRPLYGVSFKSGVRGHPSKREQARRSKLKQSIQPEYGLSKRRVREIHESLANDWSCPLSTIQKISERWCSAAEFLVRGITARSQHLKTWHIAEALTAFNHTELPRQAQTRFAGEVVMQINYDIALYLRAHRQLSPLASTHSATTKERKAEKNR